MHLNHIAIFLPSLAGGGAERVALNLANYWASHGCKVDMVLVRAHGIYLEKLSKNVRVIDLNASRTLRSPVSTCFLPKEQSSRCAAIGHGAHEHSCHLGANGFSRQN